MKISVSTSEREPKQVFRDPERPVEERIANILLLMTLEEKVECLGTHPSVPRLGIKGSGHVEGLHGLALGGPGMWGEEQPIATTTFPQAIGLAESWDPDLVRLVAAIEAHAARYYFQSPRSRRGGIVVRAPNAELGRYPRWGRTEECYGEDPYLNGVMAVAFVRGLQGDHPRYWQAAALLKHFFANSNENGRERSSSDFDERLFHEYYADPFLMAVEQGGSRAYMAAYNAHNGVPCTVQPMLKSVTVDEWKQDGIICTDAGGLKFLVSAHHYYPDAYQAAAASLQAGITQFLDDYREGVMGALERGLIAETDIDRALRGNFRVMIRLGLLDPPALVPYSCIGETGEEPWKSDDHQAAVRMATRKSIVLLKNAGSFLPLDKTKLKSIAVIGPFADRVHVDWYSGTPPYTVTPLDGIRNAVGAAVEVRHATNNDLSSALLLARESDVCIVCTGNHPTGDAGWAQVTLASYGKESVDRQSLDLEYEKDIQRIFQVNPRTVVVLISSFPYAIAWTQENVPAIVHLTHGSQELGNALADVLFGAYNPAGRLVQTWPRSLEQLPPMMDYDIRHGRTHLYFEGEPLYPFGFGLSYTTFRYHALRTSADAMMPDGSITVTIDIENDGDRAGEEVVQLYVRYKSSPFGRPRKELKGFRRVLVDRGETKTVAMPLPAAELRCWDPARRDFTVESGEIEVMVGRSSAHIELTKSVTIERAV
jgi:beta-glucosidase